jgi:hypothetical protein
MEVVDPGVGSALDITGALTITAWINFKSLPGDKAFIQKNVPDGPFGFWNDWTNPDELLVMLDDAPGGGFYSEYTTSADLEVNTWYHVSFTYDTSAVEIYTNGINQPTASSGTFRNSLYSSDAPIRFATTQNPPGKFMAILLDNVKIFNYALTPAQVAWDYNRGAPVGHWKFDEASSGSADGATLIDSSGNGNHGTGDDGADNDGLSWTSGKFGNAIDFDGDDDRIVIPYSGTFAFNSNQITVSGWVKGGTLSANYETLTMRADSDLNWIDWVLYIRTSDQSDVPCLTINFDNDSSLDSDEYACSTEVLNTNIWYHLTGTYDGSTIKFYRNAELMGKKAKSGGTIPNGNKDIWFGGNEVWSSEYFNGLIDDVRIYNYALTEDMIKEVYNAGARVRFGP